MSERELYVKTRDLLSDPARWIKGAFAKDENGEPILMTKEKQKCFSFCLIGALSYNIEPGKWQDYGIMYDALQGSGYSSLADFNDAPDTTHDKILDILDKAIELATK